jgi:antitoxin FitA
MADGAGHYKGRDNDSIDINDCSAIIAIMASITIRNIDDETKARLSSRAVQNGRSMEEEVRVILAKAVNPAGQRKGLGTAIHELFRDVGGADDLPIMMRPANRPPPDFQDW